MEESNGVSITVSELPPGSSSSLLLRFNSTHSEGSQFHSISSNTMTKSSEGRSLKQALLDNWLNRTENWTQSNLIDDEIERADALPPWMEDGKVSNIHTDEVDAGIRDDEAGEQLPAWASPRMYSQQLSDLSAREHEFDQSPEPEFTRDDTSHMAHHDTSQEIDLLLTQSQIPDLSVEEPTQFHNAHTQHEESQRLPISEGNSGEYLTFTQMYGKKEDDEGLQREECHFSYVLDNASFFNNMDEYDNLDLRSPISYHSDNTQDTVPYNAHDDDNDTVPYGDTVNDTDTVRYNVAEDESDSQRHSGSADTVPYGFDEDYEGNISNSNTFSITNIPQQQQHNQQPHTVTNFDHSLTATTIATTTTNNQAESEEDDEFLSLSDINEEELLQLEKAMATEGSPTVSLKSTKTARSVSTNTKQAIPKKRGPSSSSLPVLAKHPLIRPEEKHVLKTTNTVKKPSTIVDYFQHSTCNIVMTANDTQLEEEIGKESDVPYLTASIEDVDVKKMPYESGLTATGTAAAATNQQSQPSQKFVITRKKKPRMGLSKSDLA